MVKVFVFFLKGARLMQTLAPPGGSGEPGGGQTTPKIPQNYWKTIQKLSEPPGRPQAINENYAGPIRAIEQTRNCHVYLSKMPAMEIAAYGMMQAHMSSTNNTGEEFQFTASARSCTMH